MLSINCEVKEMNEKEQRLLGYLAQGMTRQQIADKEGNKTWNSVDQYFRRRGYIWDTKQQTYHREELAVEQTKEEQLIHQPEDYSKAGQIVRALTQKGADLRTIAKQRGFTTLQEIADYMKAQGYKWDVEEANYVKVSPVIGGADPTVNEREKSMNPLPSPSVTSSASASVAQANFTSHSEELLTYLLQNEEKLRQLIDEQGKIFPNYLVKGMRSGKTFQMSLLLAQLVDEYAATYAINKGEIVEVALVEFFQRYGFTEQVKSVLS